ncbi:MAG: ABC transporter permease [Candidatus Odinarchaeota archaeon]
MSVKVKKTLRDMRERKFQVIAIITIITLGASMYYGLSSMTAWRKASLDYTYDKLSWEDMQINLLQGTHANKSVIQAFLEVMPEFAELEAVEYRLVENTAINISYQENFTILPGKIIGVDVNSIRPGTDTNHPLVNAIALDSGTYFSEDDEGKNVAIVDNRLPKHHQKGLGDNISLITLTGIRNVQIIGTASLPDYLMLIDENAMGLFSEKQYTVMQLPLQTVQNYYNRPDQVNQIVLRVKDDSNVNTIRKALKDVFASQSIECEITLGTDHPVYKFQYEDLESDNAFFLMIALLFLVSGAFGTYVTVNRLTTAQKREIGISLAVGYKPRDVMIQYLLFTAFIGLTSALITFFLGDLIAHSFWGITEEMIGLPYAIQKYQVKPLVEALLLVMSLPMITAMIAVWKISRLLPAKLLRFDPSAGYGQNSRSILEKTVFKMIRIPVSMKISVRNVFRHKRRTLSTMAGVMMSLCLMGAMWGLIDTFDSGITTAENEVGEWTFKFESSIPMPKSLWNTQLLNLPASGSIEQYVFELQVPIRFVDYVAEDDSDLINFVEGIPLNTAIRSITLSSGNLSDVGIIISEKTAQKLNVKKGDPVNIEHPFIQGATGYKLVTSAVTITGIHTQIWSSYCFMDLVSLQNLCNATNLVNSGYIVTNDRTSDKTLSNELYLHLTGVNKVISRFSMIDETKDLFQMFYDIVIIAQVLCMILALALIYNSVYSNIHERKRELGTLRTLGTPSRTILRYLLVENAFIVILGLVVGVAIGYYVIDAFLQGILTETFAHLYVPTVIATTSWWTIINSIVIVLLFAHVSVIAFLKNLDLAAATKVRE